LPELPEVETVARQLAPLLRGRLLRRFEVLDPLLSVPNRHLLRGLQAQKVTRDGKQVSLVFRRTDARGASCRLLCHLRMTGRLIWLASGETPRGTRHVRARLHFDRGCLIFLDPRRFGTMRVSGSGERPRPQGLDPTSPAFTAGALERLVRGSRQALKAWLLRQDRLVGLGNIYASEILFAARLDPLRKAGSMRSDETRRLHRATREVLRRAIRHRGTTFADFGDAHGLPGGFQRLLTVYGRDGEPCRRCGRPIERLLQQGRSTFRCPACQQGRVPGTNVAHGPDRASR
jgi:formamidopyrimidine-DNA glycosylase